MRFSVDAHAVGCHLTGNEVYIRNLLTEFAHLDQDSQFVAYISKPNAPGLIPRQWETRWVSDNPFKRLGWDIPRHVAADRPDLLHVQYTAPLGVSVPLVVSIHDVSYLEHPEYFSSFRANQLKLTVKRTAERAAKILTPSEFSKTAIMRHYGIGDDRIAVIPNAVSAQFAPMDRTAARQSIEAKYKIAAPFVLTIGDLQPRKNHLGLLKAFERVIAAHPHLPHHLVFTGKETWYSPKLHAAVAASPVASRVYFTGFVKDEDLVSFYGACDLFVYPSFYEGFGLPILEAMACGRAVACSNTTAMPEVASSAALLFDPNNAEEMAHAICDALLNPEVRSNLESAGLHRAAEFSWERAAAATLNAYYEVAGATRRVESALKAGVA